MDRAKRKAEEEARAQKLRAQALAHLKKTGAKTQAEIVAPVGASRRARMQKADNTMELIRKRKAAEAFAKRQAQERQQKDDKSFSAEDSEAERKPVTFSIGVQKRRRRHEPVDIVRQSQDSNDSGMFDSKPKTKRIVKAGGPFITPQLWKDASTVDLGPKAKSGAAKLGYGVPYRLDHLKKRAFPQGWTVVVEAGSDRKYFWEPKTNKTSWGDPRKILANGNLTQKEVDSSESEDKSDDLVRAVQYGDGRSYYFNLLTGVSAWNEEAATLKPPAPPKISGIESDEDIGDQPLWEYLREKALRARSEEQGTQAESAEAVDN